MYSIFYHTKFNDNHIGVNPMFMVKGICNELGLRFLTNVKIEKSLRSVRRKLYQDENAFFFKVGYELRENLFVKYEVTDIERTKDDILVTVRPIGYRLGKPEKVFSEEQLYNRTCAYESIDDVKVDMRKNLVVISGSSDVGITTVVKELMKQCPELNKTVSVTTRKTFENEVNGKDYYFVSMEEFSDYKLNRKLLEHKTYNDEYYGTLCSEIDRYPTNKPLALAVDASGRRSVPLYETLTVNGKDFVLTHSGLGSFQKNKKLSEYSSTDLLWNRPSLTEKYFDDVTVIFGHTPTVYYGENFKGKVIKTETWIDVDVGAGLGLNPMLLRLDDMKEFYFDEEDVNC